MLNYVIEKEAPCVSQGLYLILNYIIKGSAGEYQQGV